MLGDIVAHLNSILDGMPFFEENYGITELKEDKGVTQPVQYIGSKYQRLPMNVKGLTYMRKRGNISLSQFESMTSCQIQYEYDIPLRLFALTKRSVFPADDAFSSDRLASTIIKGLSITGGGALKRSLKLKSLNVLASLYSTNTTELIDQELNGAGKKDFNYNDVVVAIDIDINLVTNIACITDACDYVPQFCLKLESYVALP